jgi:altronate dehydratase
MPASYDFSEISRLPLPGDNVGIATRKLDRGTKITYEERTLTLRHTILEGHRFAIQTIAAGETLLSWSLPFGVATRDIALGDYACNPQILEALKLRDLDFELPNTPNFEDRIVPHQINAETFQPGEQVQHYSTPNTFKGYRREGNRGVGTRNTIIILGTSSRTASYAVQLENRFVDSIQNFDNIDGIVAIAHTEGGGTEEPNNKGLLLRTLAGFVVHPNVGAVLAVDYGVEAITNNDLQAYLQQNNYPVDHVLHHFLTLDGNFEDILQKGESIIRNWLPQVDATSRTDEPLSHLKIALQCGGSDAFSGISGNPLASWVAREVIRHGGSANLAETDELIGAEPYLLQNVSSLEVAERFLTKVEAYKTLAAWHGTTAEGNPSGGNKFRGLYNIVLKSIGAAMKRHPDVCLDDVIDYAAPMTAPGYYFMDSPGNDLESIAGQVSSGCNMIFFITGNGSITNFPFAPTIKIVTTSERYHLLSKDMDVNAGAYLDGTTMDDLGSSMFDLTCRVASGERSKGEKAGHAQVSIWRNWRQISTDQLPELQNRPEPRGTPLQIETQNPDSRYEFEAIRRSDGFTTDRIGLILPTSLCSGQIAKMAAERLTAKGVGKNIGISRFVGLAHTEGCGVAGESTERIYTRTMVGYLTHPTVHRGLLLEHGCEKTHNDYIRHALQDRRITPDTFGWASVQLDGGIENVLDKVETWFTDRFSEDQPPEFVPTPLSALSIGLHSSGTISDLAAQTLTQLSHHLIGAGATLIVPDNATFLQHPIYLSEVLGTTAADPTLAHGQQTNESGYYIMDTQTDHWVETLTGLGGTGAQILAAYVGTHPMQGHPLIPILQATAEDRVASQYGNDLDLILKTTPDQNAEAIIHSIVKVASRQYTPKTPAQGNTDFQFTRGLLGVSM